MLLLIAGFVFILVSFVEQWQLLLLHPGERMLSLNSVFRFSIDEGRSWTVHNFTSTSVFVDGLLSEPGDETLVMT